MIHPDDRDVVLRFLVRNTLLADLGTSHIVSITYRQILDGRTQYVRLMAFLKRGKEKNEGDSLIVCVRNIDAVKRMEMKYSNVLDMANRDSLTGVKNKCAYAQAEMELDDSIEAGEAADFGIAICDINGLKIVNDTKGHKAGDEYIKSGAKVICNVFRHSPVFRIGGDEFAVILRGNDYETRNELIEEFKSIQNSNKEQGLVTIAVGISDFDKEKDIRVQDVFERADTKMYTYKEKFKNY